jgi:hypothetical protein
MIVTHVPGLAVAASTDDVADGAADAVVAAGNGSGVVPAVAVEGAVLSGARFCNEPRRLPVVGAGVLSGVRGPGAGAVRAPGDPEPGDGVVVTVDGGEVGTVSMSRCHGVTVITVTVAAAKAVVVRAVLMM